MLSQKKLDANRRNALKSTGPKTEAGKVVASQNGLTHGLTSRKCPVLPGENIAEYDALRDALLHEFAPSGMMQREIVIDLVNLRWKLRRVPMLEAEIVTQKQQGRIADHQFYRRQGEPDLDAISILASEFCAENEGAFARLELYRLRLERSMHSALRAFRKLREEMPEEVEEDEVSRDTGLRPVQSSDRAGEERDLPEQSTGHGPEARVTGEQAAHNAIRKSEPTNAPNPLIEQKNMTDETSPLNGTACADSSELCGRAASS